TGNYQLAFGGYTTSFLPVTAADAQVQAALIALPSIGGPAPVNAVQTLTVSGAPTGGTFQLSYNGATTAPIAFSTNAGVLASNIQLAVDALSNLDGNVVVANTGATTFTLNFGNNLAAAPVNLVALNSSGL